MGNIREAQVDANKHHSSILPCLKSKHRDFKHIGLQGWPLFKLTIRNVPHKCGKNLNAQYFGKECAHIAFEFSGS